MRRKILKFRIPVAPKQWALGFTKPASQEYRNSRAEASCRIVMRLFLGCVCLASTGCWKPSHTAKADNEEKKLPIKILISCDTNGWIVPCGCSTKQSGGLLRRGTLVAKLKSSTPTMVLDAGGAAAGKSDYHRVKLESILRGELAMGLAAHNLGASEVSFGPAVIREIQQELSVPFLSANVRDADNQLLAPAIKIVECGKQKIAVIGVLDPAFSTPEIKINDPRETILNVLSELDEPVDGKIVLAYLRRDALVELAQQLPEIDAIVGGPTGQTIKPYRVGATLVAAATNKGKFVVSLNVDPAASIRWAGDIVEVDDSLSDAPKQVANLEDYHAILKRSDFNAALTGLSDVSFVSANSSHAYAGNDACLACHRQDCDQYKSSKHAMAWKTLEQKQAHVDPYCQQCHTTGYGTTSGFASIAATPHFFDVGCESCHGPSSQHIKNVKQRTTFVAKDQCAQCHDRENSPLFEYNEYWKRIIHGTKVANIQIEVNQ